MKKLLVIAAIALVVLFAARHPGSAAGTAKTVGSNTMNAIDGLGTFFGNLTSANKH